MKATFNGQLYGNQITLERVNKQKARRLFNEGKTIYMQSSNMRPFGVWSSVYPINMECGAFEDFCYSFSYYNCTNETGRYIHFYIEI